MLTTLLRTMGAALDGIEIGFCAFDAEDRALAWNSTFLELFPEHAGHVRVGEPYADNLRRYYGSRLVGEERALLERYVTEGVERHRAQRRPFEFDHRGQRLRVSSLEMGSFGRVRVWRKLRDVVGPPAPAPRPPPSFDSAASVLLERIADGVLVVDAADRALWANQAFLALYGLSSVEAAAGRRFEDLYLRAWEADPQSNALRRSLESLRENQRYSGAPYELELPGDRWVRVVEQRGDTADGRGYFVHADITALKRQQQALRDAEARARDAMVLLEEQAVTDALTGLANRRRFDEALAVEWRRAQRDVAPLALLMVDIDDFKTLNDSHGHPAGDAVLARLGGVLASFGQRAGDIVARYGGEEFALLLPNTGVDCALAVAEKLRRAVTRLDWRDTSGLPSDTKLSVSVGVCCADAGLLTGEAVALVRRADEALYAAKRAGRNRVVASGRQLTM